MTSEHHPAWGIWLFLAGIFLICFLDASARFLSTTTLIPLLQIIWLRFVMHALVNIALFSPRNLAACLHSRRPALQWLRAFFMMATTILNFLALKYLQLDQAIVIFFLSPLLIALLSGPFLGEYTDWRHLLAIGSGFVGVLVMAQPGFGGIHWAAFFSLGAVGFYALYAIMTRYLAAMDPPQVTQFYTPLLGVVLLAPFALVEWVMPQESLQWLLLLGLGIFGGLGHYLIIHAHHHAPAPVLAPFVYIALPVQSLLGFWIFHELPQSGTFWGGSLIIGSGLYLMWLERRSKG